MSVFGLRSAFGAGIQSAGRALVHALDSDDESVRTLAGMFLVQSGRKSIPLIREEITARRHLPMMLTMLGDIAAPETVPEIERFTTDSDPAVARAANDALEILRLNRAAASSSAT
jgi:HEAT repeat protein